MTKPALLLRPTSHPMINKSHPIHYKLLIVLLVQVIGLLSIQCCVARDTIRVNSSISDNDEMLESAGRRFQLGFFSPNEEDPIERYVGIWYYNSNRSTVVWVANRDKPVSDTSGVFALDAEDGQLKVLDGNENLHFSTDLESTFSSSSNRTVQLLDSGNLVLFDNQSGKQNILWESFGCPTDTFLPGMNMSENLALTSWSNTGKDPRRGNFTFEQSQDDRSIYLIRRKRAIYRRSGELGKSVISSTEKFDMPNVVALLLTNFSKTVNPPKTSGQIRGPTNTNNVFDYNNTRLLMNSSGQIQYYGLKKDEGWSLIWSEPDDPCSEYNACGKFGICNSRNKSSLECKCLEGFKPTSLEYWNSGDYSNVCTRKSTICNKKGETYEFLNLTVKSAKPNDVLSNEGCRESCLEDCSCQAYAYNEGDNGTPRGRENSSRRCMIWTSDLVDLKEGYADDGYNLSVRVPISDIESTARDCKPCGNNIIPYPLSTGPTCGDPMYHSFNCNEPLGPVLFQAGNSSYRVSSFNPEKFRFVIIFKGVASCTARRSTEHDSHMIDPTFPFNLTNPCYFDLSSTSSDSEFKDSVEVEIGYEPPFEPMCNSSKDCGDWPNSSCNEKDGQRKCLCKTDFFWNPLSLNCSLDVSVAGTPNNQSEPSRHKKTLPVNVVIISTSSIFLVLLLCIFGYIIYRRKAVAEREELREAIPGNPLLHLYEDERRAKDLMGPTQFVDDDKGVIDVPFFEMKSIQEATDNFSNKNKLGQGGFGPVYRVVSFPSYCLVIATSSVSHSYIKKYLK